MTVVDSNKQELQNELLQLNNKACSILLKGFFSSLFLIELGADIVQSYSSSFEDEIHHVTPRVDLFVSPSIPSGTCNSSPGPRRKLIME